MPSLMDDVSLIMPMAAEAGLFPSLCTIQKPALQSPVASGTYSDVTGLINLPCQDAPEADLSAMEVKALDETASILFRHVVLYGYFPQLSPDTLWGDVGWRAVIDGLSYDILGALSDSARIQTTLRLRKVSV